MSEKEKKRRACYRKNREKWIFAQAVIIAVLAIAIIISALVSHQLKSTYYIDYRESGSIDYNVFLKENEFFEKDHLGKNQSYVASLIDKIVADFSYEIDMDADDVNYRYSYSIDAELEIIDNTSKVAIFNPKYELVKVQNKSQSSSNRLNINEIVVINYDEYNDLANKFLETYGLTATTSNIVVTLSVDVLSDCNAFSGSSVDNYSSELRIPLTTKTVNINMTSAVPGDSESMIACTRGAGSEVFRTTAIVLTIVDVLLIILLVAFIYLTRTEDITYTARVKKILSQYKSYIQKINNAFDPDGYQIIFVDKFDEMLEIRDTIQAPILLFENADKTCAKFMIPTDSKLLYCYEIKMEGYTEPEVEKKAAAPTTVVQPNITNVVKPIVKVVLSQNTEPKPNIETVVEQPEIEIDDNASLTVSANAEAETETSEPVAEYDESALEIEELIASIPEAEEPAEESYNGEDGVDAIDVRWNERLHKTYRYDPNGNQVEDGDVVLVPTMDTENNKEVVREAEVTRGNYKVDPDTLDHPLKKIIGVVRRKAKDIFVSMITPEDKDSEDNK